MIYSDFKRSVKTKKFEDFIKFGKLSLKIKDYDPGYPILKKYYELRKLNEKQKHWHTLLFMTFYRLSSAEEVFKKYPEQTKVSFSKAYPTSPDRRGLRGKKEKQERFINQFNAYPIQELVTKVASPYGKIGWAKFERIMQKNFWYVGTWTTYKWADILNNVYDFNIEAPYLSDGGGSVTTGPIGGMISLLGVKPAEINDTLELNLYKEVINRGLNVPDYNTLETLLCDFKALTKGKYYLGHDIDSFLAEIQEIKDIKIRNLYLETRKQVFDYRFLGEINGWQGVRDNLKKQYKNNKTLQWW
tara:strand:- start:735 stop:1637 length:903 start_codon:yes stop_codon:yes gene_type:complete